ncbi:transglutaminase-like domain-containing protein [Clostridium sp.]|uniref:transglutaminase-like domain-containing protein n=1 Tax=Clostridium sp. TaxID=1506 RepID=UPI003F328592
MITFISYAVCFLILFISIKGSLIESLEESDSKYSLNRLLYYFSVFLTFTIMMLKIDKIYVAILRFGSNYISFFDNFFYKVFSLAVIFFLGQFLIYILLKWLSQPLISSYSLILKKGKIRIILFSTIFGFLKGSILILILFMAIITFNSTIGKNISINLFQEFNAYKTLDNIMITNRPVLDYDTFKEYLPVDANVIVYYNGVTLEEGIRSTEEIDNKAKDITKNCKNDREKAKKLYSWVGSNITYDMEKANKALKNEEVSNSGAIEAWNTRRGICFDYACLYVAMAKSTGLKVRLITGEAFDGTKYGPHAWNEVYLEDEDKWIKLDPTFYLAGDYFDNKSFDEDHIADNVAGEW